MKKIAIILLSLVLIATSIAIVACKVNPDTCNHEWSEWVESKAATCTEEGEQTRTCSICEKVETQTVDSLGHQVLLPDGSVAKCRDIDLTGSAQCSRCNETISGLDLYAAVEHITSVTLQRVEPTCTTDGLTEGRKCVVCGNTYVLQETIPALGHEAVNVPASAATCTEPALSAGSKCSRCGEIYVAQEELAPALGHDFSHGNYFSYVECSRNCGVYGKLSGGDPFTTDFIYDFDDTKKEEIDLIYAQIKEALSTEEETQAAFVELFEDYDAAVSYVQAQYQFARVLNDINYNKESREEFSALSEYYNTTISRYYGLFKAINESSKYGSYFWAYTEWDADYIQYVLDLANSYDLDNRNAVDEIIEKYEDLLASIKNTMTEEQRLELYSLYSQLVIANNNIATTAGYENYMEYAYERIYERDYKPADVEAMRSYVKEYIGPIVADIAQAYSDWSDAYTERGGWTNVESQLYYSQFVGNWMWGNPNNYLNDAQRHGMIINSRQSIADYFKFLNAGDSTVDFYGALENLFKTGNFFMGANTNITAYTWYIYSTGTPILVFGGDSNYQDAFTFVHEFGHYYQFTHNGLLSVPMDHDETQSQGNEMLFLAWLRAHMPANVYEGFEIMELEQLINMLGSIVLSTAVDELEYLVYTGADTYNDAAIATVQLSDGSTVIDYGKLYENILKTYWSDIGNWFNTSYWMYVTFNNAAYYISYAMSALPCLELYAKAGNEGLEAARASYLKLFTFSSDDGFVAEDSFGDLYVTKTYEEILNAAGLGGPFQKALYETISDYFASR